MANDENIIIETVVKSGETTLKLSQVLGSTGGYLDQYKNFFGYDNMSSNLPAQTRPNSAELLSRYSNNLSPFIIVFIILGFAMGGFITAIILASIVFMLIRTAKKPNIPTLNKDHFFNPNVLPNQEYKNKLFTITVSNHVFYTVTKQLLTDAIYNNDFSFLMKAHYGTLPRDDHDAWITSVVKILNVKGVAFIKNIPLSSKAAIELLKVVETDFESNKK